ncbi:amino acid ABC transporter permease [Leucobacter sp. CSA1]|uniref:Amino acid ABC transporter permease n=1 Tax=Leucobacter chromiisoli TaxID=2796471 RepID=A0A934Q7C5_9MICO|nr:amino acid ABC transporter permease [Leucobacter chromiisoli]MBK0418798.1 amino acid ABC transporter permease [Leucobacter chromiisoli]
MSDVWDWEFAVEVLPKILEALPLTLVVSLVGGVLAIVLGLLLALARLSPYPFASRSSGTVSKLLRGTPFLVQLFFVYYALPQWGVRIDAFWTGVIVLCLYYSVYMADAFISGVQTVSPTLIEVCAVINLTTAQAWRRVILPLAVPRSSPSLMNYLIMALQQSAVLMAIGLGVLLGRAQEIGYSSFRYLETYTICGLIYIVIAVPALLLVRRLEKRT